MSEKRKLSFFSLTSVVLLSGLILGLIQPSPLISHVSGATNTSNSNRSSNSNINGTSTAYTNNSSFLMYKNLDFGIKMQYPSNWTKQEDNLQLHTIAAFSLIHQNPFDFANVTLAEVDLRVYNAPKNETSAKLNISQINTQGQTIVSYHKNSTTTLGGYPAFRIASYFFGGVTQKAMQIWTFIPNKHVLVEIIYIAQPSKYSFYLPIVQKMIDSVEIAR
jgi:hypothetical protein